MVCGGEGIGGPALPGVVRVDTLVFQRRLNSVLYLQFKALLEEFSLGSSKVQGRLVTEISLRVERSES